MDPRSSNNSVGFFHYLVAHLMVRCNVSGVDAAVDRAIELSQEAQVPAHQTGHLADVQLPMASNAWEYRKDGNSITCGQHGAFEIDPAALRDWERWA